MAVNYTFDNANRLTKIAQGTTAVQLAYDNANRRASLTLPNGIVMTYAYDNGSQLTGLTYTLNSNTLGTLTYSYDMVGRRTLVGGTYARTGLPNSQTTTGYDAANELTTWGTATPTYDLNGNVLSDGTNTYVWNARNQLASMNMSAQSFQYDPLGRRVAKTVLATTTNYLYDGVNPVQELSGTTPTANLVTGSVDEFFQRTDSTGAATFLDVAGLERLAAGCLIWVFPQLTEKQYSGQEDRRLKLLHKNLALPSGTLQSDLRSMRSMDTSQIRGQTPAGIFFPTNSPRMPRAILMS